MLCQIWGIHGGDYEECRLLWYKNPVLTSQEIYYVSITEPSRLMLCRIWDIHGSDYKECGLLGYGNPDLTSQETHYYSFTGPSQLKLAVAIKNVVFWYVTRVAFVRIDVSVELFASIIRMSIISELGTRLVVTSNTAKIITFFLNVDSYKSHW
jgi:hypothetical protein